VPSSVPVGLRGRWFCQPMESSGGPDGGSDVSYESIPSEGGIESACDRGRDQLPRIISSSHCVEVFRRLRCIDGAYCCRASSPDDHARDGSGKAASGAQHQIELRAHDPLAGLPSRLMRFDGAMEAWLEETPRPRGNAQRTPYLYTSLNDAGARSELSILRAGNRRATLWYFTLDFLQQVWPLFLHADGSGLKMWERALLERGCTIQSTHIELGRVHCPQKSGKSRSAWLQAVFSAMQASKWCPDGEAQQLLLKRRLSHASMSIGDAIQIGGELFVVGMSGFVAVKEGVQMLPPMIEPDTEDEEDGRTSGEEESDENGDEAGDGGGAINSAIDGTNNGTIDSAEVAHGSGRNARKKRKKQKGPKDGVVEEEASKGKAKGGKGGVSGKTKGGKGVHGKAKGKGGKGQGGGGSSMAGWAAAAEGRWVPKAAAQGDRADRRAFRAQLQAERERHQQNQRQ